MKLIANLNELVQNIEVVEKYLIEGTPSEMEVTRRLIQKGICFVAYTVGKEMRFAPSRFVGYQGNSLKKHTSSKDKDGRETNKAINKLLEPDPVPNERLERLYLSYCHSLGISPGKAGAYGAPRKYWTLPLRTDFIGNQDLDGEFPEGKVVERLHKMRERNPTVVKIAKARFKAIHGKLFCQACQFDFEEKYGNIGADFVEGHHSVPVSELQPNHKTKPEDIILLCSNCHRMIHKKRPWIGKDELQTLLK
ncbi:MAG TPA: HNH endonuclease [Puia sp.]|uniref:HNH endonuclease n=1 Tax=Puia sp. TaxID=2045100 RepID=UPI002C8809E1|nr:HNH endonuclease [Puia sp.]HVU94838.1 HNH endonuclease [Puia sp.]